MKNLMPDGVKGKDIYYNPSNGEWGYCLDICKPSDRNDGACTNYCPEYIRQYKTEVFTKLPPVTFAGDGSVPPELIVLVTFVSVGVIVVIIYVVYKRQSIARWMTNVWQRVLMTKPGVPPSDYNQEETGQRGQDETVINIETDQLNPGAPVSIPSGSVTEPLLPGNNLETEDIHNDYIPDTADDHVSTDLRGPDGTEDLNSQRNDEAVAREYQLEQDKGIRGKKETVLQFGRTEPMAGEDEVAYTDQPGRNSISLESNNEKTMGNNQNTNLLSRYSCTESSNHTTVSTHSNEPTELAQSVMNEEQRRRDSSPPLVADRNSVAQNPEDELKQTENALNGQVPLPNFIA
ncbi:hypothetical protein MAR_037559 [Mya arenaria]|uniref:Uncharacterized protein n=1 Tax=Mya arenaria TaxID=6604 RepID=A0ABY7FNS8_MYAAR|nr:uncharacterized protein LOC128214620 [Mya arenaria]WAR23890.1 hypothetical protein MAR_037559 [Mya arenaria]